MGKEMKDKGNGEMELELDGLPRLMAQMTHKMTSNMHCGIEIK